ncbi:DNA cytosine methyltransferase [Clostridium sp. OS1-26]|uniref:DNA cytosine methyltransferase n=1 Tax=Clostridium sp. OS1-26 TaxID=3070681 RepID=UPI0027E1DF4C|nr:DNA cytosine methyltransferase [Clostridium sp. OS1-26]WML35366.1 DNA cytosine methyltransferase [Clostridium sp. OS1-26]
MKHKFKALYLFCGIGGGALGFQESEEEYKGIEGSFETICGIDCDPEACQDFQYITGSRAECMDLFSREQYISFHGKEPGADWREVTAADIKKACDGEYPDVVFTSPPCKGFSGLLPEKSAKSEKYQALNKLTIRGIKLICEAFKDSLPSLILLENVPRITTRGKGLLDEIKKILKQYGYAFSDGYHDCGEIGGLAQHRKRYLLICRNVKKLQGFVYEPPVQRVKAIGEVLEELSLPGDESMGVMHRIPRLAWKTWVRLALIPAGGDWRDLNSLGYEPRAGAFRIIPWEQPSTTITAATKGVGQSNGASAVADPRIENVQGYGNKYQVVDWNEACTTITGSRIGSGAPMVADVRLSERKKRYPGLYKVNDWKEPASTIIGQTDIQCGALSVNDPRIKENRHTSHYRIVPWNEPSGTVTGATHVANGLISVQDVRYNCTQRAGTMEVMKWDESAKTITSANIYSGATAIADPRIPKETENGVWIIISVDGAWHRPLTTLELAALQGLPTQIDGQPLKLAGNSDSRWRERIGNMVPVGAGKAIAETMLRAMLPALKDEIVLGWTPIWVNPIKALI